MKISWIHTSSLKRFKPITQVYGICFNENGEILIFRAVVGSKWQLPGGKPEVGETIEETLSRELLEEVDIRVKDIKVLGTQKVEFPNNPNKKEGAFFTKSDAFAKLMRSCPKRPTLQTAKFGKENLCLLIKLRGI